MGNFYEDNHVNNSMTIHNDSNTPLSRYHTQLSKNVDWKPSLQKYHSNNEVFLIKFRNSGARDGSGVSFKQKPFEIET